jgi:hypothetical protein
MALLMCSMALPLGGVAEDLYGPRGVKPEAVRQGRLGSCYFHAVIAALAQVQPQALQRMIQSNSDGTYTVRFADDVKENAYAEDIRYTRESGYDLSEGLWVAVIFRAYAQRVLRQALVSAVEKSDLFPFVRTYAKDFISSNDPLLLSYDRAIRSQVSQNGDIDRSNLELQLKQEMKPLSIPDEMKDAVINLLQSGGFFDSMAEVIKQNGEIFGAYRAVGQGGIAERVMKTLTGSVQLVMNDSEQQVGAALDQAFQAGRPVVACSGGSLYYQQLAQGRPLPAGTKVWYVNAHCYTALAYDGNGRTVTLRNPWATFPGPEGLFTLPLKTFVPAFRGIITTQ